MRAPSSTAATDEEPPPPAPAIAIAAEDVHMHDEDGAAGESTSASTPELTTTTTDLADLTLGEVAEKPVLSMDYILHSPEVFQAFARWSPSERADFLHRLVLPTLTHLQLGALQNVIRPMLQRDFIATLPYALSDNVLTYLDAPSLRHSERVSVAWRDQLATCQVWKKLLERSIRCDRVWAGIAKRRGWDQFLLVSREEAQRRMFDMWMPALRSPFMQRMFELRRIEDIRYQQHAFYQLMYAHVEQDIKKLEQNWRRGVYTLSRITCQSIQAKGVYCLQYDDDKIVSGLRDTTIKIWNRSNLECVNTLTGHTGSVLCLQYDDKIIVSGSSDATVRVWCVRTGECLNQLIHHQEAVLHLRFSNGVMVTCSKDRMIAVWDMHSPKNISIRQVLSGHRAAVNVVDFDSKYIVSASGDRTIRVWNAGTLECERTLTGHKRGIACLQYRERLIVSGSSDCTIRLWDIVSGTCIRVLEGHEELVRCIRFDSKRIVSGAYDGKIKVWDLQAALDPQTIPNSLCLTTLSQHTGRVFRLQFDDFQIVSSSHDDTILIWDFLDRDPCGLKTGRGNAGGFGAREDDASLDVVQQEERAEAAVLPLDGADEEEDEP